MNDSDKKHRELMSDLSWQILKHGAGSQQAKDARQRVATYNAERTREAAALQRMQEEDNAMAKAEYIIDGMTRDLAARDAEIKRLRQENRLQRETLAGQLDEPIDDKPTVTSNPEPDPEALSLDLDSLADAQRDEYGLPRIDPNEWKKRGGL